MRLKAFGIVLLFIITVLLVACDPSINEKVEEEDVWAPIDVTGMLSKSIQVEYGTNIGKYEYKITPITTDENTYCSVTTDEWIVWQDKPLTELNIHVSQGEWKFELRVYKSETSYNTLTPIQKYFNLTDNVLDVGSIANTGDGYLEISELKVPRLYEDHADKQYVSLVLRPYEKKNNNTYVLNTSDSKAVKATLAVDSETTNVVTYKLASTQVTVGNYLMTLELHEKIYAGEKSTDEVIGKEVSIVKISNGLKTTVHGTSNPEAFVPIELEGLQTETGITGKINVDSSSKTSITLTCSVEGATSYRWYYNGELILDNNGLPVNTRTITQAVKTGSLGVGFIGSTAHYFDCIFEKNKIVSSCSKVCFTKGTISNTYTDASVFTLNTGDEITKWSYRSVAPNELKSDFSFMPVGEENEGFYVVRDGSPYISKGYWSFSNVTGLNDIGHTLGSNGAWSGYINGATQKIGVRLNQNPDTENGKVEIKDLVATCTQSIENSCGLDMQIFNLNGTMVAHPDPLAITPFSKGKSFKFNGDPIEISSGTYRVLLHVYGETNASILQGKGSDYHGYCNLIINVYDNVTTEITGQLSFDYT